VTSAPVVIRWLAGSWTNDKTGTAAQGYGLAWSPFLEGNLLSGSDDAQICLWDIAASKGAARMEAKSIYHEHAGVVEVLRVQDLGFRASGLRDCSWSLQAQGSEQGLNQGRRVLFPPKLWALRGQIPGHCSSVFAVCRSVRRNLLQASAHPVMVDGCGRTWRGTASTSTCSGRWAMTSSSSSGTRARRPQPVRCLPQPRFRWSGAQAKTQALRHHSVTDAVERAHVLCMLRHRTAQPYVMFCESTRSVSRHRAFRGGAHSGGQLPSLQPVQRIRARDRLGRQDGTWCYQNTAKGSGPCVFCAEGWRTS